jgi:hypothetical protein
MKRKRDKVQKFGGAIRYQGRDLFFKATIRPARKAPHVGADSPRFLEPGRRAEVKSYTLHYIFAGRDVTLAYASWERDDAAICRLILHEWEKDQIKEEEGDKSETESEREWLDRVAPIGPIPDDEEVRDG